MKINIIATSENHLVRIKQKSSMIKFLIECVNIRKGCILRIWKSFQFMKVLSRITDSISSIEFRFHIQVFCLLFVLFDKSGTYPDWWRAPAKSSPPPRSRCCPPCCGRYPDKPRRTLPGPTPCAAQIKLREEGEQQQCFLNCWCGLCSAAVLWPT